MSDNEEEDDYDYEDAVSEVPSEEPIEAADAVAEDASDEESESESVFTEEDVMPDAAVEAPRARADPITTGANTAIRVIVRPADQRVTDHRLQKSEASHIISVRAQQIARSATNYVAESPALALLTDPCEIAHRELIERRCPLLLRRQVGWGPNGEVIVEEWNPREMALPALPLANQSAKKTVIVGDRDE
jgi:hypothetical protein